METSRQILESFTFRNGHRETTVHDAIVDGRARRTVVSDAVAWALGLRPRRTISLGFSDRTRGWVGLCPCEVAWAGGLSVGFSSTLEVIWWPGADLSLIGQDFLTSHSLKEDPGLGRLVRAGSPSGLPLSRPDQRRGGQSQ